MQKSLFVLPGTAAASNRTCVPLSPESSCSPYQFRPLRASDSSPQSNTKPATADSIATAGIAGFPVIAVYWSGHNQTMVVLVSASDGAMACQGQSLAREPRTAPARKDSVSCRARRSRRTSNLEKVRIPSRHPSARGTSTGGSSAATACITGV